MRYCLYLRAVEVFFGQEEEESEGEGLWWLPQASKRSKRQRGNRHKHTSNLQPPTSAW